MNISKRINTLNMNIYFSKSFQNQNIYDVRRFHVNTCTNNLFDFMTSFISKRPKRQAWNATKFLSFSEEYHNLVFFLPFPIPQNISGFVPT